MKAIVISTILMISSLSYAKTVQILTDVQGDGLQRVRGKLIVDDTSLTLSGKARITKIGDSSQKIHRFFFTDVENGKQPTKYFKKPLVLTVAAPSVKANTTVKFDEKKVKLKEALANLLDRPSKQKAVAPESSTRMMLVPDGESLDDASSLDGSLSGTLDEEQSAGQQSVSRYMNPDVSDELRRSKHRKSYESGDRTRGGRGGYSSGVVPVSYAPTSISDGTSDVRKVVFEQEPLIIKSKGDDDSSSSTKSDSDEDSSSSKHDGKHNSSSSGGDSKDGRQNGSSKESLSGILSGDFELDDDSSSLAGRRHRHRTSGSAFTKGGRHSGSSRDGLDSAYEVDDTKVVITSKGCPVRVDYDNDRVIIQNKAITYKSGKVVDETDCRDSSEFYLIKKDYLCRNCDDFIDLSKGFACPTFEKFWTNKDGRKIVLSTTPEKDLSQKFPITKERGECEPVSNIEAMKAYPQVQLVYTDRVNAKKVAKICHVDTKGSPSTISLTMDGCTPIHDFKENWTIVLKKGVFTMDDKEYTAFGCKQIENPIQHDWDIGVCTTNVDVTSGRAAVMGKRYVIIEGVKKYLSDCEPTDGEQLLMETVDGCEGQYVNAQEEGRSYFKKRWYFLDHLDKQFVTACIKSTEYLPHKVEITGYEHDDGNRKSKRITTIYIVDKSGSRIDLWENYINPRVEPLPYELVETKSEPTDSSTFSGCYKITQTNNYKIYKRPDETILKQFSGIGTPIKSKDLCKRQTETQKRYLLTRITGYNTITHFAHYDRYVQIDLHDEHARIFRFVSSASDAGSGIYGSNVQTSRLPTVLQPMHRSMGEYFQTKRHNIYQIFERLKTSYPNGHVEYSEWHDTGKTDYSPKPEAWCKFNWGGMGSDSTIGSSYITVRVGPTFG